MTPAGRDGAGKKNALKYSAPGPKAPDRKAKAMQLHKLGAQAAERNQGKQQRGRYTDKRGPKEQEYARST